MKLTTRSLELFLEYARDAANWGGQPQVGGNVGGSQADRGNLTHLKKAGLISTYNDGGNSWIEFTNAGVALAESHGIIISTF